MFSSDVNGLEPLSKMSFHHINNLTRKALILDLEDTTLMLKIVVVFGRYVYT